jgi:uncharacterized protein with FMN-binding domain
LKKSYLAIAAVVIGVLALFLAKSSKHDALPSTVTTDQANTVTTTPAQTNRSTSGSVTYKDGSYTGSSSANRYGYVQVKAVISGGKLSDITYLQLPDSHQRSVQISSYASPKLKQEAISAQSADVNIISGATSTSDSFAQSLKSALDAAKVTASATTNGV